MATDHELRLRERLTRLRSLNLLGGTRVSGELEKLPENFGLAEQNLRFGHIDAIVPRPELKPHLARLLRLFSPDGN